MPVSAAGHPAMRRSAALFLLVAGVLLGLLGPTSAQSSSSQIDVLEIDGVVDRAVLGFLRGTIQQANADGSNLVAIELNTPGGLNVSAQELIQVITASEVPVLTFVPTSGRASSAGTVIAYASHVLAMSPVSRMGAATPVDLGDAAVSSEDTAARLVALAEIRGRDTRFAAAAAADQVLTVLAPGADPSEVDASAVPEAGDVLAVSPEDAVAEGYVDLVEPTLSATLDRLSGYEIRVEGGDAVAETVVLDIDGEAANVRFHNPGLLTQILHTAANPTLTYLLVVAGALAIAFEVFQPGFGVAGLSGLVMAGLGTYGLAVLPVSWPAFGLVVLGLVLLALDLALARLGPLTVGGTAVLGAGSFLLFTGPAVLRVSPWVIGPVVLFTAVFFVAIMTTVLRAQGSQALTGAEAVIGETGVVRSMLNPEGHIFVRGALWRARAPESAGRVRNGTRVRVIGLNDQLTLDVEPVDADVGQPVR